MREILFRGQQMWTHAWVEGNYAYLDGEHLIYDTKTEYFPETDIDLPVYNNVYPETVGQYTGLQDKNGTKIFENQSIRLKNGSVGKVEWGNYGFCLDGDIPLGYLKSEDIEIIEEI